MFGQHLDTKTGTTPSHQKKTTKPGTRPRLVKDNLFDRLLARLGRSTGWLSAVDRGGEKVDKGDEKLVPDEKHFETKTR